jgi:hypothetical protein
MPAKTEFADFMTSYSPRSPRDARLLSKAKSIMSNQLSLRPRAAKPTGTADTLLELLHLHNIRGINPLQHKLRHPVALGNSKVGVGVVKQQNLNWTPVIGVDDARPRVDKVLDCQTGARGNTAVCVTKLANCGTLMEVGGEGGMYMFQQAQPC